MKKLIKNAKILNENNKLINVNILINENIIEKIYENNEKNNENNIKIEDLSTFSIIDAKNNLVLPGFINPQSHLLRKFFHTFSNFSNLEDFNEEFENFKTALDDEEKYLIYKYEIENAIENGITSICDEDFFNLPLKKAVLDTGINFVYKVGLQNCLENFDELLIQNLIKSKANFVLGLNNVFYNNEENFSTLLKLSKQIDKPIICNGSKNIIEEGNVDLEFNTSTIKLLESFGFLDYSNILYSQNIIEKDDLKILQNNNTNFVFSPSFNLSFACPTANIYAIKQQNKVSLSSFKNDIFLEMYLAKNLENNSYDKLNLFSSFEIYNLIKNNAKMLSLQNIGEIKEGYKADFVVVNLNNLTTDPNQIFSTLSSKNILYTIINGEVKYNKFYKEEKMNEKLQKIIKKI